ncbi:DUF1641 domain-containing protein [Brevibacillus agri]
MRVYTEYFTVPRDPDINRAMGFGINLLKGVGEGLKD